MTESFTDKITKGRWLIFALLAIFLLLTAESCDEGTRADEQATDAQLVQYQRVQPIPKFEWSQYRETLIGIETARANGTATTSFFFNTGVDQPIRQCDSIGYPVPSTQQITNPDQITSSVGPVAQMEPNGTYTGESTATYVVCLINGKATPEYFEGFVHTVGGPAKWDTAQKMIIPTGPSSVTVKTK